MYRGKNDLTPDRDDPIIDAALAEVLGGEGPPDLTAAIMAQLNQHQGRVGQGPDVMGPDVMGADATGGVQGFNGGVDAAMSAQPTEPPLVAPPVCPPHLAGNVSSNGHHDTVDSAPYAAAVSPAETLVTKVAPLSRRDGAPLSASWGLVTLAACLIVGTALLFGMYAVQLYRATDGANNIAENTNDPQPDKSGITPPQQDQPSNKQTTPRENIANPRRHVAQGELNDPGFDIEDDNSSVGSIAWNDRFTAEPLPQEEIIATIDKNLRDAWAAASVEPAPAASDAEFARRVYLQMVGRIPTVEELEKFTNNQSLTKKDDLVDRLLGDEYREEFADHWAGVWANVLVGRMGGRRPGDKVNREGLEKYLRDSLAADKPYDVMVRELIAATGSNQPGAADFNGATNFVLSGLDKNATQVAAKTSRVFLGRQLQCMQCHDHPVNEDWNQHEFWQIASFFRQAKPIVDRDENNVRLVNQDYEGQSGDVDEAEVFYNRPNGKLAVAYPVFFDGTALPRSGRVVDVDRRAALAKLITRSEDFPKAAANRLWATFFHHGFTKPIDDLGPHQAPSHPEILNTLAEQFAAHDFDQKKLMRWIALSDAYGRSSQVTPANRRDNPLAGTRPLFSHYYTRQLPVEAVYDSVLVALGAVERGDRKFESARLDWLGRFSQDMNTDDGGELSIFDGSITQSLEMMNGDLINHATSTHDGSFLQRVASGKMTRDEKIAHLFLSALAREPSKAEQAAAKRVMESANDEMSGLQDLWWALLNSNEFILDH